MLILHTGTFSMLGAMYTTLLVDTRSQNEHLRCYKLTPFLVLSQLPQVHKPLVPYPKDSYLT